MILLNLKTVQVKILTFLAHVVSEFISLSNSVFDMLHFFIASAIQAHSV